MDELLGAATIAALDATGPTWRDELVIELVIGGWSLELGGYDADPARLAVLLRSPASATLRQLVLRDTDADLLAGATLPALERLYVGTSADCAERPRYAQSSMVEVDAGALLAAAPNLELLTIECRAIRLAAVTHPLRTLSLVIETLPAWTGVRLPALERLELAIGDAAPRAEDTAWLLDGTLAPSLRQLRLYGAGFARFVLALRTAPALARLEYLDLGLPVADADSRALVDNPGRVGDIAALSIDRIAGAPWLDAFQEAKPPRVRNAAALALLRGCDLFLAAPPAEAQIWEWSARRTFGGILRIARIPLDLAGGPHTLEEAMCALAGMWMRSLLRRDPRETLEPSAWEEFLSMARPQPFAPLATAELDRELESLLDSMRRDPDLEVTEDHTRALPDPHAFAPRIGPANRAIAALNDWHRKLLAAETDDAYVLLGWSIPT